DQRRILGRRGLESGPEGPVRGFDTPKMRLWSTALAAREKRRLDCVASSVAMLWQRATPNSLPGFVSRRVTGISMYEFTA
ncbi:MAG: hypothetical protein ACFBZ9_07005, partial [Sphingomonadales bacterium]